MGIEVRETSAGDLEGIAGGFARSIGRATANGVAQSSLRERIAWILEANPEGVSSLVAVDSRGVVVGHVGAMHLPMLVRGERRRFGRRFACFTDPEFRIGGVHGVTAELDREFADRFEGRGRIELLFGLLREEDFWWMRQLRDHIAIRTAIELVRPTGAAPDAPTASDSSIEVVPGHDDLYGGWTVPIPPGDCVSFRDGVLQRFRCSGAYSADESRCAVRDGVVIGSAIVRATAQERVLLDWAVPPDGEHAAASLLHAVVGDGAAAVRFPLHSACRRTMRFFQQHGFRVEAGGETYLAARISGAGMHQPWLSSHWTVTAADAGLETMGRMTSRESIIGPPPPGTTSGRERHGRGAGEKRRRADHRESSRAVVTAATPPDSGLSAPDSPQSAPDSRQSGPETASPSGPRPVVPHSSTMDDPAGMAPDCGDPLDGEAPSRRSRAGTIGRRARDVVVRSFFPLTALAIIASTVFIGPWLSLVLAYATWRVVGRIG